MTNLIRRGGRDDRRFPVWLPILLLATIAMAAPLRAPAMEEDGDVFSEGRSDKGAAIPETRVDAAAAVPEVKADQEAAVPETRADAAAAVPAETGGQAAPPGEKADNGAAVSGGASDHAAVPAGRIREVTVTKTPYSTNIEALIEGKIESFNSFKLNDPFRIVLDIWGIGQGAAAPEIAVDTPQVRSVRFFPQDGKLRLLVETPGDRALPFLVNADGNKLVLSVGGGQEEKVTSRDRPTEGKTSPKGLAVTGIDLEDLPGTSSVVITTSGEAAHEVGKTKNGVTIVFPGAAATKDLLRPIDARKFEIPIRTITPAADKKGVRIAVAFAPGSTYTVTRNGNTVVVDFPKRGSAPAASVVARLSEKPQDTAPARAAEKARARAEDEPPAAEVHAAARGARSWGFLSRGAAEKRRYIGQRVSMDFKDADLANVFRIIAEVSNLNIITTDDVKGKVSVRLVSVPWDQALDIVLRARSLGATMEGNIIRIAPIAAIRAEEKSRLDAAREVEKLRAQIEAEIETIPVNYSKASDLQSKVKDLLSEGGKMQVDDRTNVIVIRDLQRNIDDIKALVSRLDTPTPQVLIEARIVEVDTSFTRELGVQWGGSYHNSASTQFGVTGIQGTGGAPIPGQTLLNIPPFTPTSVPPNYVVNLPAAVGLGSGGGVSFGILRDNMRLDLSISAMEAQGKGKVISSPKVVTVDNREAVIEQGTQIPYSTVSASGTNTQFVDATLSLKVKPHITPGGSIIMTLEAKNDSLGDISVSGQPAINKKKANTEVLIRDGETAVIGGILQITRKESLSAVPWFWKIPILGLLFRKDLNTASNRELLIFITPKILRQDVDVVRQS